MPTWYARLAALPAALLLALLLLAGCATLPEPGERSVSHAPIDTAQTRLGRAVAPLAAAHPGRSGARALLDAREAFVARYALALAAERSIDAQYYIWRNDTSGSLMAQALWDAAERGVRVRVLLDDANTGGLDAQIAALDAHPNVEVRLFNPFANRSWRLGDLVLDFARVNRRMHNKSFTVDNQATVVGGRNIGDEYLGAETPVAFTDLDVLAVGPVVREVSTVFDEYWNAIPAWPAATLLAPPPPDAMALTRAGWDALRARPEAQRYLQAMARVPMLQQLQAGTLPFDWVRASVVTDDADKILLPPDRKDVQLTPRLEAAMGRPEQELLLVSPYFVPGRAGSAWLQSLAARGVRVAVLTNSLAATDVGPVYAGYVRYRAELLAAGVRLFELKPAATLHQGEGLPAGADDEDARRRGIGSSPGGSSGASLHAKTFGLDRRRVFVGSFNLDPRSVSLNTEMGLVLDSPMLAGHLADAFERTIPDNAYELRLEQGRVVWLERTGGAEVRHTSVPGVGVLRRMWIGLLSLLPIEGLL